jgi:hypothetical protein
VRVGVDAFLSSSPLIKQLRGDELTPPRQGAAAEKKPTRLERRGSRALELRGGDAGVRRTRARVDLPTQEKKEKRVGLEGWWDCVTPDMTRSRLRW